MVALKFDAGVPVALQITPFSCSVGATYWCLRSLDVGISQQDLQDIMVPSMVSAHDGLLDGSGATIAQLLRDRWGIAAQNVQNVTFDAIAQRAGSQPVLLGGHRWYTGEGEVIGHWVAVRGFDGERLVLANPAGTGPKFGQQSLDSAAFDARAPFSAVWIDAEAGGGAAPRLSGRRFRVANTNNEGANLRREPRTDAERITALAEGTQVVGDEHAWRLVTDATGQQGWMAETYLDGQGGHFKVARTGREGANLRPEPSVAGQPLKTLPEASELTAAEHAWRHVIDPSSGKDGWLAHDYLVEG